MKSRIFIVASVLLLALSTAAFAMNNGGGGGNMGGHDMGKGGKMAADNADMDHSGHRGMLVHESKVGMYQVAYHLIDNMAQMAKMDKKMDMAAHKNMKSNHLMTYFAGQDGKNATGGKVGFLVVGPDGSKQKAMAMEMNGGYGADIDLKAKGKYTVKVKGVFNGEAVMDAFTYEVK